MRQNIIGFIGMAAIVTLALAPQDAAAAGCLKGGAVGGVVGHEVGSGHAVAGAAAGCVIGHHEASKAAKQQNAKSDQDGNSSSAGSGSSQPPADQDRK